MATKAPAPSVNPFDNLLAAASFEDKSARSVDRDAIVVPQAYQNLVEKAHKENKRVNLPITDKETFDQVGNILRAAGDRAEPKLSVQCSTVYDGEGDDAPLVGMKVTVGPRRGARKTAAVKNADASA